MKQQTKINLTLKPREVPRKEKKKTQLDEKEQEKDKNNEELCYYGGYGPDDLEEEVTTSFVSIVRFF